MIRAWDKNLRIENFWKLGNYRFKEVKMKQKSDQQKYLHE